ncbi:MAG: Response regulator rcp1 [Anaerolineae bacterium]|nr:Response regulator rcp1 [Anaerolineae bacterium]
MTTWHPGLPIEILLVEDNPGDIRLTEEALLTGRVRNNLHVVTDGVEALAFVNRQSQYKNVPVPDLILLDLNLPKKDGRQVLAEIKASPDLKRIPVVVLTTSESDQDILKAYEMHANS